MRSISFKELRAMTPEQKDQALAELVEFARQTPTNGAVEKLTRQVRVFEESYGIDSAELRRRVSVGVQEETDEVLEWLMLLNRRDLLESIAARPR